MADRDTIAAIATAPGRAGIGVVRISGRALADLSLKLCGKALPPRMATLCDFGDGDGGIIDRGLALYFPAPQSYTGEDVLELQGHGGPVVLQRLLKRCLEMGARVAEPGEFSKRAYLNGKMDLAQAEGVADLIDASTEQAARCAQRSIHGEFSAEINELGRQLVELRALTEATLDFPEEEIDTGTTDDQVRRLGAIQEKLSVLLSASDQGSLLREGALVVLAGQPNAGKSSLLNRLAGEEVAIVTEIPGTTRDAIRQSINLFGVPVHMIDTAGLRESSDAVEKMGIARTWAAIAQADLAVLVIDAVKGESAEDRAIAARLPTSLRCLQAFNKSDLARKAVGREGDKIVLSAKTGEGMDDLRAAIAEAIGWRGGAEGVFMARARHLTALRAAQAGLARAATQTRQQEFLAQELREAHGALMSITGEVTPDDLLGEIFAHFCIGK
ncbi:MAG: tRNA uridine-5-carboxymethylaminomethyl(34) synthesis GTPase MnmE [Burkholderiales bacterium]